jgi:cytochrome c oxidase assembly factor CtaG
VEVLAHGQSGDQVAPLTPLRLLTGWTLEPFMLALVVVVAVAYLVGVRRLHARGDAWPVTRTLSFIGLGLGSIVVATQSALGTYDDTLLSTHMVQHMVLSMVSPVFLALGAPITLALRTLPPPWRSRLLALLHSRVAAVLSFPPVSLALFIISPWALYMTGWYDATLHSSVLHALLHLHFLVVGCLFFWPILGLDPVPGRMAYPFRMMVVFATLPFHAFLGIAVMSSNTLIAADWYRSLHLTWGPTPMYDQFIAGSILWVSGDLVGSVIFGVLFVQWVRESQREAAREDRRLDRLDALSGRGPAG